MMRPSRPTLLALSTLVALVAPAASPAQGLTPQQVMNLERVTAAHTSPDGEWIAYTVRQARGPDADPGGATTEAFVMPADGTGEPRALPATKHLQWRPDTDELSYVHRADDDDAPQLYSQAADGGEPQRLTDSARGIGRYAWRPDGQAIACLREDPVPEQRAAARERGFEQIVVDEDYRHVSLWLCPLDGGDERRLTSGKTVRDMVWSPDGERLAVGLSPRNIVDDGYVFTRLWQVDATTGEVTKLVDNPGKLGDAAWSPDGRRLAYISAADRRDPHAGMLYVVDRESGEVTPLTPGLRGMVHHLHWLDANTLDTVISRGVHTALRRFELDAGPIRAADDRPLPMAARSVERLPDGRHLAVGSTATHPEEVYIQHAASGDWQRLTHHNAFLDDVTLGQQQVVRFAAGDGLEIEGLLIHPTEREADARHPLVIVAHGGPEAHYSDGWNTRYSEPGQVLAGRGYFVWYPNYRSSTGYGVEFAKADHGDPMGREFQDHLDAVAHFADAGLIDDDRVGIIGGSYGGYTAAWAATRHSAHFAAAVSFVPFVDIRTKWLTSDIPYEFYFVHYQETWPHRQRGFLSDRSPLSWAEDCRTPLLLCGGTADTRVHPSQPFMLHRAVKFATETPTRYVQYPGEGHGNASNVYQYDYMLRALRWFDHYLAADASRRRELPPRDVAYPAWR